MPIIAKFLPIPLLFFALFFAAALAAGSEDKGKPAVEISTPDDPKKTSHRIVKIRSLPEKTTSVRLPIPFGNIVRAWNPGEKGHDWLRWSFNKDATEITLHLDGLLPPATAQLITAEKSGRQADGLIVLSALDATPVGKKAKLETHPGNHRIGFWSNGDDYVKWHLENIDIAAGSYIVELVYSRSGAPGAEASVTINGETLPAPLRPSGSWYIYHFDSLGEVTLPAAESLQVEVRSVKQKGAVMNLKAVLLRRHD